MEVFVIKKNELQVNEGIRDREVRLIDEDGKMIGILSSVEARKMANAKNLDLVKIVPNASPPVCKITDYGKSLFEKAKREKQARKNTKTIGLKEVRLSPKIEEHDFEFKAKNTVKFLESGNKVKVSIRFRGREMKYVSSGEEVMAKFSEAVKDAGTAERAPKLEGRSMMMILVPKKP